MTIATRIRELFNKDRSPKTNKAIAFHTGCKEKSVVRTLQRMDDAYIHDWLSAGTRPAMLWVVVEVPKNAPPPTPKRIRRKPKTSEAYLEAPTT